LSLATTLHADTASRNPTSDDAESGTWSGGSAGTRYTLVDDHPDSSGADFLTHGTTAGNLTFGLTAFAIPAGSTSISVQVVYYDQKTAAQGAAAAGRLKVGGNYYNASTHNPANGTWTLRTDSWATNPKSGSAWTVDDVNGVGSNALQGFGFFSNDANPTIRFASVIVQITYTPPASGKKRHYTMVVELRPFEEIERCCDLAIWRLNRSVHEGEEITQSPNELLEEPCQALMQRKSIRGRASCGSTSACRRAAAG
jgi:hypothetical protein